MTIMEENYTLNEIINNLNILNIDNPYSSFMCIGRANSSTIFDLIYKKYFTQRPLIDYMDRIIPNTNTNTTHNNPCVGTGGFINRMYEYIHDKEEEKKDERRIIYVVNKYSRYKNKYMYDNKRTMEKRKIRKIFKK
jgi:hypothetical protein